MVHLGPVKDGLACDIIKWFYIVTFLIAIFMYKLDNQLLPPIFWSFFTNLDAVHSYNFTRLSAKQSYHLPKVRTNYGKFNIRFQGPTIWNAIDQDIKVSSISSFKKKPKEELSSKVLHVVNVFIFLLLMTSRTNRSFMWYIMFFTFFI